MNPHSAFDGTDARQMLDQLVRDEPDMTLDAGAAARLGRRLRRRRQFRYGAYALGTCAVLTAALVATPGTERSPTTTTDATGEVMSPEMRFTSARGVAATGPRRATNSELAQRVIDAVRSASPEGWTVELAETTVPGVMLQLDGTADNGTGPGRLLVFASQEPGSLTLRPCADPEFNPGVACEETVLDDGSVLSVRDIVDFDGISTVSVSLARADGTGIGAESGNFLVSTQAPTPQPARNPGEPAGSSDEVVYRAEPSASRPDPTYTAAELRDVVLAVHDALR